MSNVPASRVMSGNHGYVWINGKQIAEVSAAQAKVTLNKESVQMCGQFFEDQKVTGAKGTGNVDIFKVYSCDQSLSNAIKNGEDLRTTVIMALKDPAAFGFERVALYNCSFDELTLIDFAAGKASTESKPFTFTDYEFLDKVTRG